MSASATDSQAVDDLDRPYEQLWTRVKVLLRHEFSAPQYWLPGLVFNALVVVAVWILIDPSIAHEHTALIFFPLAFASWVFADVFVTNLFGNAPDRWRNSLDDGKAIRAEMTARNLAFWILVSPICIALCIAIVPSQHDLVLGAAVFLMVLFVPFGYFGMACLVAPLLPYHPLSVKERLTQPGTWVRFGLALLMPFLLTFPAAVVADLPVEVGIYFFGTKSSHMLIFAILTVPWALFLWQALIGASAWLTGKRRDHIRKFLTTPGA